MKTTSLAAGLLSMTFFLGACSSNAKNTQTSDTLSKKKVQSLSDMRQLKYPLTPDSVIAAQDTGLATCDLHFPDADPTVKSQKIDKSILLKADQFSDFLGIYTSGSSLYAAAKTADYVLDLAGLKACGVEIAVWKNRTRLEIEGIREEQAQLQKFLNFVDHLPTGSKLLVVKNTDEFIVKRADADKSGLTINTFISSSDSFVYKYDFKGILKKLYSEKDTEEISHKEFEDILED